MSLNVAPIVAAVTPVEYRCRICNLVFRTNRNLSNHVNTTHNEEALEHVQFVIDMVATGLDAPMVETEETLANHRDESSISSTSSMRKHRNTEGFEEENRLSSNAERM